MFPSIASVDMTIMQRVEVPTPQRRTVGTVAMTPEDLIGRPLDRPTVSPLLTPITFRNILFLQSLPNSIPYRQDNVRRRKDDTCLGTATRRIVERLSRVP